MSVVTKILRSSESDLKTAIIDMTEEEDHLAKRIKTIKARKSDAINNLNEIRNHIRRNEPVNTECIGKSSI